MIKDSLANAQRYAGLPAEFQQAFAFLAQTDVDALPLGRADIAPGIWANVQEYTPLPADEKRFEMHFAYADVQFVAAGSELLMEAPVNVADYHDEGGDCCLLDCAQGASTMHVHAGDFCIVWPGRPTNLAWRTRHTWARCARSW